MCRFARLLVILLLLVSAGNIMADDDDDCAPINLAREIDAAYNTFLIHRSTMESEQMMQSADDFSTTLQGLLANCGSVATSNDPHFIGHVAGEGTSESPYGFAQAGLASNGVTIRPMNIMRPASDVIQEEEPANHEWAIISIEASCPITQNGNCDVNYNNFRLVSENGEFYDSVYVMGYADLLEASIPAGRSREGDIAFIVPDDVANLRLVYYPQPYEFWPDQDVTYYRAQPSVEITATARLIIRNGAGTGFAALNTLEPDTRAAAIGRNADGTWIRIDEGWVSAAYISTNTDDIALLPILEPEN